MADLLLLGSTSASRQKLLSDAKIPYTLVHQSADESQCDWGLPLQQLVESIALYKMEHLKMPAGKEGERVFVLTADTLSQDSTGAISGKPIDKDDAIAKIKAARNGMRTGTAFCLDKKIFNAGSWQVERRIIRFVDAHYCFSIPDVWIERYLSHSLGLKASGAIAIEEYGSLFLESVQGSYTTIVGLPLFQVRQALEELGFNFG